MTVCYFYCPNWFREKGFLIKNEFELYAETGVGNVRLMHRSLKIIRKYIKRGSKKQEVHHYR